MASTDESRDFQAKHPSDDCMNQALCLSDFAKASKTDTGWIVTVVPFAGPKRMFLTVAAERSDGVVLASARKVSVIRGPKETRSEALQRALLRIAQEAKEKSNELTSLVPTVKPAPVEPKVTPPIPRVAPVPEVRPTPEVNPEPIPPPATHQTNGLRIASYAFLAGGVIGFGVAGGVGLAAQSDRSKLQGLLTANGSFPRAEGESLAASLNQKMTVVDVGLIAGGLLAGAGIVTFILSGAQSSPTAVSVSVGPRGAALTGSF